MDRAEIRNLNPKVIRWWLSILSIYRVIEAPRKVKLNTITDGPKFSYAVYSELVFRFKFVSITAKRGRTSLFRLSKLKSDHLRPSTKAGPNGSLAFTGLFGSIGLPEAWSDLFKHRSFVLREPLLDVPAHTSVRYGTGQPMGCLSSWAMLAVCHHFIVQACCMNVGMSKHVWHICCEILGDDIVIFDKDVYTEYVRVMSELGVETNPSKSIISDKGVKVLEFAKRTALNGTEVSGLSWKQLASTARWKDIILLILSLGDRHLVSSHGILIRLLKFNFKSSWRKETKLPNAKS